MPTVAELNARITANTTDFDKNIKQSESLLSSFSSGLFSAGEKLRSVGGNLASFGAGITAAFAAPLAYAIKSASDLNESMNKTKEVFGDASASVVAFAEDSASKLGLSKAAALDAAGGFGNLFTQLGVGKEKAAEMSTSIVALAADFASFHNADISEVLNAQSAAFRGEYDSLQRFLPLISAATVEQEAMAMTGKKATSELTAQEKALAVNALMFKGAGAAAGDFARTSDGMANVMRIVRAQLENLATEIGAEFLPYVQKALVLVRGWMQAFTDLSPSVKAVIVSMVGFGAVLGPVLVALGAMVTALGALLSPIGLVVAGVAALALAFATNFGGIRDAVMKWADEGKRYYQEHKEEIDALGVKVKEIFENYIQELAKAAASLIKTLGDMKATIDSFSSSNDGSWKAIVAVIKWFVTSVDAQLSGFSKVVRTTAEQVRVAFEGIKNYIIEPIKAAIDWIKGASGDFLSAFTAITNAAKMGLVVHSPPIAAQWVMMIGDAAEASAKRVKSSSKDFQAGFEAISSSINRFLSETGKGFNLSREALEQLLKIQPEVVKQLYAQAKAHENLVRNLEVYSALMLTSAGRSTEFATTISRAIGNLLQLDKAMSANVNPTLANYNKIVPQATLITDKFADAIEKSVGSLVEQTIAAKKAGDTVQKLADEDFKKLLDVNEELSRQIPHSWNSIINAIVNTSGKAGDAAVQMAIKWKGMAADIVGIADLLPGKIGGSISKVIGEVERFFAIGDKILSILGRLGLNVPNTMGDIVEKIIGVFKKKKPDFEAALDDLLGKATPKSGEAGAASGESFAAGFLGKMAGIASGVATFFGTRGQGKLAGVMGGAMGGAQIGASIGGFFGPAGVGIGAAIGGIGGAIAGLFGSGKSKAQKKAEEDAAKAAALQMEQTMLNIQQSILDVMSKGAELIEQIYNSSAMDLPRKAIKRFINKLMLILTEFVEQSKEFKIEAMQHAKAVSENLGGSIELMLGGAQLMDAIKATEAVSDEKIKAFVDTTLKIIQAWTDAAGEIELGAAKFAGKISEKLKSSFELLRMIPDTIKGLLEASAIELTDEQISKPIEMAKKVIDKFFTLAEEFRGYALKQTTKAAEQFKSIFESTKSIFEALKVIGEFKPIEDSVFDAVTSDFAKITSWMDGLIATSAGWLTQADTLAANVTEWAASLARSAAAVTAAMGGGEGAALPSASMPSTTTGGSSSSSSTTNITLNGVQLNGDDPRTRAAVQALTDLFGMGGGMETMVGSYGG